MTDRKIKYDYFEFKKLHEEHNGNILRMAMILSKERPTIRNWIEKMKRDDGIYQAGKKEEIKRAYTEHKKMMDNMDEIIDKEMNEKHRVKNDLLLTKSLYKKGAKLLHPDITGDNDLFLAWKRIFKK